MLGLPQSTEVKRPLPKTQLYKRFDWKPSQRESFDADVSRLDFVNWISPRKLPAIREGEEVKEIYVIEVVLKNRDFNPKNITLLAKSIPQNIVYLLSFEDEACIAVYYSQLFHTEWQPPENIAIQFNGLNLDIVWENIVRRIAQLPNESVSLHSQIIANEERAKIERQIAALERQMFATKQPRRKREIFEQLKKLKELL